MKLLEKFTQVFSFTHHESRVIVFLVVAFVIGGIVKVIKTTSTGHDLSFDYTSSDSEFNARSSRFAGLASSESTFAAQQDEDRRPQEKLSVNDSKTRGRVVRKTIDLNKATKEDFMKLPGIGKATAEAILHYRADHGSFKTVDELLNVKGIGKKKLERIMQFISVGK